MRCALGSTRRSVATRLAPSLLAGLLLAALGAGPADAQAPPAEDTAPPAAPEVPHRNIYRLRGEAEARSQVLLQKPRSAQAYRGEGTVLGALSSPRVKRDRTALAHRLTEALREGQPQTAAPAVRRVDDRAGESAAPLVELPESTPPSERSPSHSHPTRKGRPDAAPCPATQGSRWWLGLLPPLAILAVLAALAAFGPSPRKRRRAR